MDCCLQIAALILRSYPLIIDGSTSLHGVIPLKLYITLYRMKNNLECAMFVIEVLRTKS